MLAQTYNHCRQADQDARCTGQFNVNAKNEYEGRNN